MSSLGGKVKRPPSVFVSGVNIRPGCQKNLEASGLVDAGNASNAHLDDLYVSVFGGILKWCPVSGGYSIDIRSGCQEILHTQTILVE